MFTLTLCLAAALQGDAGKNGYARPELLLEPAELAKSLDTFIVLDARPKKQYEAGHVPDAVWVDHELWSKKFGAKQAPEEWAKLIGALGIDNRTRVVSYDDAMQKDAARIWWILRYWGVKDARLLNGGWKAWTGGNHPIGKDHVHAHTVRFSIAAPDKARLADKEKVLDFLKDTKTQIIDARSEKEYCGDEKLKNKKGGAIPGAMHLEWTEALDKKTHKFKSPSELTQLFKDAGIDLGKRTVTHCQSGGRSSVTAFTLELMGAKEVANYYRGWSEWGNSDDTPIVRPKKK